MRSREDTSSGSTNLHIYAPAAKQGKKRGKKVSNDVHKTTLGFIIVQICIVIKPLSLYLFCKAIAFPLEKHASPVATPQEIFVE